MGEKKMSKATDLVEKYKIEEGKELDAKTYHFRAGVAHIDSESHFKIESLKSLKTYLELGMAVFAVDRETERVHRVSKKNLNSFIKI